MATCAHSTSHSTSRSGEDAPERLPADVIALGLSEAAPDCLSDFHGAGGPDLIALALSEGEDDVTLSVCRLAVEDVEHVFRCVRQLEVVAAREVADDLSRIVRRLSRRIAVVAELHLRQIRALRGEP